MTVADAAWAAATLQLKSTPSTPGYCLAFVRVIIEYAHGWKSHELYTRHLTHGTTRRPGDDAERLKAARLDPWASDLERSLKMQGLGVPWADRQAGDLCFNANALEPFGHVGVLIDQNLCVELIDPRFRKGSIHVGRNAHVTRLQDRPWTLIARLPG